MSDSYGEMFDKMIDRAARHEERTDIFRRNDISRNHFYNVINPNRSTTSGNPYYAPIEWLVKLTRDLRDYWMLKRIARDCGCLLLTPDDVKELKDSDPEKAIEVFKKIVGLVK
jgi:hypothetical protein